MSSSINMPTHGQAITPLTEWDVFHATSQKFVNSAKKIANNILQLMSASKDCEPSNIRHKHVYHHHHDYGYNHCHRSFWSSPTYIVGPSYGHCRSDRDDNNSGVRTAVGLISVGVGAAAFYAIGNFIKSFKKVERKLEDNKAFTTELKDFKRIHARTGANADLVDKLEQIATLREKILVRMKHNNLFKLAASVAAAAACTMAAVGAIIGSSPLMAVGTLTGLATGAVIMVNWGMSTTDSKQKRDAREIIKIANEIPN